MLEDCTHRAEAMSEKGRRVPCEALIVGGVPFPCTEKLPQVNCLETAAIKKALLPKTSFSLTSKGGCFSMNQSRVVFDTYIFAPSCGSGGSVPGGARVAMPRRGPVQMVLCRRNCSSMGEEERGNIHRTGDSYDDVTLERHNPHQVADHAVG
ncbi:unnamed protein product [Heligmosomoides polygyrus]|uniref:Uncharacterized protein n=1 Tax=Heligmosomoides polygyrus TaxID=6339 RepID=A0A183GBA7_HELPZ|nr:unnamed protein product [Heligmosomoides polygyrus]